MMLPPVSLPMEKPTSPAAVAAARPGARTRRAFVQQPGILRLPAKPDVVQRQRAHAQLGDQHRARLVQTLDHGGIVGRHAISVRLSAVGGGYAGRVEQILTAPRDAVQRSTIVTGGDLLVGLFRLGHG